ncbi:MAG: thioredoxin fold domain-containing protein [Deltaproteobacteria bacterium]|nr:thioredoxin fold domain-containing protein [Deltaproteobacteria bacterium]
MHRLRELAAQPCRCRLFPALCVLALLLVAWRAPARAAGLSSALPWTSHQAALAAAAGDGRPVLLYFWAPWCYICKKTERLIFSDPVVQRELPQLIHLVAVEANADPTLVAEHQVRNLPSFVFLNAKGETVLTLQGYLSSRELLEAARRVRGKP